MFARAAHGDTLVVGASPDVRRWLRRRGLERYDRTAAACSLESRSPFTDRRVVEFFQTSACARSWSWMAGRSRCCAAACNTYCRRQVVWNRGKPHLAIEFAEAWIARTPSARLAAPLTADHPLHEYVDVDAIAANGLDDPDTRRVAVQCVDLGVWLETTHTRCQWCWRS